MPAVLIECYTQYILFDDMTPGGIFWQRELR